MTFAEIKNTFMKFTDTLINTVKDKKEAKLELENNVQILSLIKEAKENLEVARNNFNFATDDSLLEYRIYELKAAESRLGYFLKMAKEENIRSSYFVSLKTDEGSAVLWLFMKHLPMFWLLDLCLL